MTGILKIDLPNDFKKGDCLTCQYADNFFGGCKVKSLIKDLGSLACPLEIQGECETCKNIASALCPICSGGKANYYERAECSIELRQENNQ